MNPRYRRAALGLVAALVLTPAGARQADAPVREEVLRLLREHTRGLGGEVTLDVTPLDPGNQLPACSELHASLPPGSRAWGRTTVAVRCDAPARWTVYVPVQVRVVGEYLVLARALRPGQIVGPDDLARRRGDLAAEGDGALLDATQAIGHPARFAVAAGQPLRREMLRLPPVVRRGERVRIQTRGAGFSVSNEGRALNDAADGQPVRVRIDSGKVLSGTARLDGSVDIDP